MAFAKGARALISFFAAGALALTMAGCAGDADPEPTEGATTGAATDPTTDPATEAGGDVILG